jgi:hypothetical protein
MTYRRLAALPFVLVALSALVVLLAPSTAREAATRVEVDVSKLLAFAGLVAAARAFDRGDYLRRAWGAWAASYACFLLRDAVVSQAAHFPGALIDTSRGALVLVGNVLVVAGAWMLARAWRVAGMQHPGTSRDRVAVQLAAVLATAAFVGPIFVVDVRSLLAGQTAHVDVLASDLGDLLTLPIVAPVALTAVAVRAGTLRWPWTLLTSSLLAWLLYDAIYAVPCYFPVNERDWHLGSEQFHVLAGALACAAGLAQRRAVLDEDDDATP